MKGSRYISLIMVILLSALAMTGCESYDNFKRAFIDTGAETEETVRIAVYEPLSGPDKEHGELEKAGILLANKMFPTALGKEVELLFFDNKSDIYIAEAVVQEMIENRVALVLGSYGSVNSLMAVSKLEEAKIPAITVTNTNPLVTSFNPYYFRVSYTDSFQGIGMAKYAAEKLELKKAAILKPLNDDFASAVSKSFASKFVQITGDENAIVYSEDYISLSDDFNEILTKISESEAEAIFLPSKARDAETIIKAASKLDISIFFLGTDLWETESMLNMKFKGSIQVAYSTLFDPKAVINPLSDSFLKAYKREYGDDAEPKSPEALAFDAYLIGIDAINRAGTAVNGEKVMEALKTTSQFKGASGTISFDSQGDPIKSVSIIGIKNGKAESLYTVEPTWVVQGM